MNSSDENKPVDNAKINPLSFAYDFKDKKIPLQKLIQVKLYGVSLAIASQPVLLLKDDKSRYTLPVALNPVEAGLTLAIFNKTLSSEHVHAFSKILMKNLKLKISKCIFNEIKGSHQYVTLYFEKNTFLNKITVRADEAISLCLSQNVPMYASVEFIRKSSVMNAHMDLLLQEMHVYPDVVLKKSTYMN